MRAIRRFLRPWALLALTAVLVVSSRAATPGLAHPSQGRHEHHQPEPPPASPPDHEQHQPPAQPAQGEHARHGTGATGMFHAREASGTAWLPDATPMYGLPGQKGSWQLMGHGNAFAQYLHDSGDRGDDQFGSINWFMGMARRPLGGGRFGLRGMVSVEAWSIAGCGYPDLLATGEICESRPIHDRQHPHDLFMELAADYERPLRGATRWQIYGGIAGEPALGPVAYPHRPSAFPNPLAPISHHWLDATHIQFGVITAGVYGPAWKAEASIFNGREPDEERADLDLGVMDSWSGRFWYLPTSNVALQVSGGHLNEAEVADATGERADVDRFTASATYHRKLAGDGVWASTLAWGRNGKIDESTHFVLFESSLMLRERDAWFGRVEAGSKPAHDLDVAGTEETFTVAKLQVGYTRYLQPWRGLKPGIGGSLSLGILPSTLEAAYGGRALPGLAVFVTVRPAEHRVE